MPQLDPEVAQTVADTEASSNLMEEGIYETVLIEVKGDGNGPAGPYWTWVFKNPDDSPRYKGWQHWVITSLSPDAAWKMKETFEAFGVSPPKSVHHMFRKRDERHIQRRFGLVLILLLKRVPARLKRRVRHQKQFEHCSAGQLRSGHGVHVRSTR